MATDNRSSESNVLEVTEESEVMDKITIEVVYGVPHKQKILTLLVDAGSTVEQAIYYSGVIALFPEIDLKVNKVGIWNRAVKLSEVLTDLDRIEVYRPLIADPKDVRKRRAEKAKQEGRADKTTGGRVNPLRVDANK